MANRPEAADSNFTWDDFQAKNDNELVNNFGNFINRSLKFISTHFAGRVPAIGELNDVDRVCVWSEL
jgi:methionyl-tRNA synthetase